MRIEVLAIGRMGGKGGNAGPEAALLDQYLRRITFPFSIRELVEKKPLTGPELKRREGELLLGAIPEGAVVVALDERGKSLTSPKFAEKLRLWRDDGVRDLVFVIGGADGLDEPVRQRADLMISFGAMTWPHMMVRGMLAEQVYRAQCILAGHPYHRE